MREAQNIVIYSNHFIQYFCENNQQDTTRQASMNKEKIHVNSSLNVYNVRNRITRGINQIISQRIRLPNNVFIVFILLEKKYKLSTYNFY